MVGESSTRELVKQQDDEPVEDLSPAEPSQRYPVAKKVKAAFKQDYEQHPGSPRDYSLALARLKDKLEERTMGNYKRVLEDLTKGAEGELLAKSGQMLKRLSIFKPQQTAPVERSMGMQQLYTEQDLEEEKPLSFKGQPIKRFEDLLRFVNFEVTQMPDYSLSREEFDPALEKEIRMIRDKNKASCGGGRPEDFGKSSPPIDNLILLTAIDQYLNERDTEDKYFSSEKALANVIF